MPVRSAIDIGCRAEPSQDPAGRPTIAATTRSLSGRSRVTIRAEVRDARGQLEHGLRVRNTYLPTHDEAWRYLVEELRPDVALVQEALVTVPAALAGRGRFIAQGAWRKECRWGSGVYVPALEVTDIDAVDCEGVHAAAAIVNGPTGPVLVTSVHVGTQPEQERWLATLTEALGTKLPEHRMIVGGDFNAARRFDEVHGYTNYKAFFAGMQARGFFECHWRKNGREVQSFWGRKTVEKYQDDHFFVNESLGPQVVSCEVIDNADVRRLSDHGPAVLVIDV